MSWLILLGACVVIPTVTYIYIRVVERNARARGEAEKSSKDFEDLKERVDGLTDELELDPDDRALEWDKLRRERNE